MEEKKPSIHRHTARASAAAAASFRRAAATRRPVHHADAVTRRRSGTHFSVAPLPLFFFFFLPQSPQAVPSTDPPFLAPLTTPAAARSGLTRSRPPSAAPLRRNLPHVPWILEPGLPPSGSTGTLHCCTLGNPFTVLDFLTSATSATHVDLLRTPFPLFPLFSIDFYSVFAPPKKKKISSL